MANAPRVENLLRFNWSHALGTSVSSTLFGRIVINLNRCLALAKHGFQLHKDNDTHELGDEVLRACIVLLHSSFEDFLRSLTRWLLPLSTSKVALAELKFPGGSDADKRPLVLSIADLGNRYRNLTVQQLIEKAVGSYCDRMTISNTNVFEQWLMRLGYDPEPFRRQYAILAWMMERRHRIAHEADLVDEPEGFSYFGFDDDDNPKFAELMLTIHSICLDGLHPDLGGGLFKNTPTSTVENPKSGPSEPLGPGPQTG